MRSAAYYRALAAAVKADPIPLEDKVQAVKWLCRYLKKADSRFSTERFSEACYTESEW